MKQCNLYLNYAGYCEAKASHSVKGDPPNDIKFRAMFGLIQHPNLGWILFDTGYTRRFYEATQQFPNKIYAKLTKVTISEKDELKSQLAQAGISTQDINHVILSHFHADHIGGLKDFNHAQFYCSKIAWQEVISTSDFWAFRKGILKALIPDDFSNRLRFIEDIAIKKQDDIFNEVYDVFHDDSVLAFGVPGHAAGQMGIKLQTQKNTYLLVADACWDIRAIKELALPHPIVKLFFHSWKDYKISIRTLKNYHTLFPEHAIVPTHCFRTTKSLFSSSIDLHVL